MECAIGIFKCWETMYPRVYCPGRGDSITTEGTLYPRVHVNCPWGTIHPRLHCPGDNAT